MSAPLCALVLAAGEGRRYQEATNGQDKLLAPCKGLDGVTRPILEQVLVGLSGVVEPCLVVTRPGKPEVCRIALEHGCEVLELASGGMGQSLAAAVAARADARGWLVILGDMPFIRPETLRSVLAATTEQCISVPVGGAGYGHPVAFGRAFGPALMALTGDQGARRLFSEPVVRQVPVDDPGIYHDVDTPAALS